MLIIPNNTTPLFKQKLIPASEYKGPILKLTKNDKKKIDALNHKIGEFELELHKLEALLSRLKAYTKERLFYEWKIDNISGYISDIKDQIYAIKLARIAKQRAREEKKSMQNVDTTDLPR